MRKTAYGTQGWDRDVSMLTGTEQLKTCRCKGIAKTALYVHGRRWMQEKENLHFVCRGYLNIYLQGNTCLKVIAFRSKAGTNL